MLTGDLGCRFIAAGEQGTLTLEMNANSDLRKMRQSGQTIRIAILGALIGALVFTYLWKAHSKQVDAIALKLESIAAEAAAGIDGRAHADLDTQSAPNRPNFIPIRNHLRSIKDRYELNSDVYTLRRDGHRTQFVVMTNEKPFSGDFYTLKAEMLPTFQRGARGHTSLYGDAHGQWISAYAPVRLPDGSVDAIVCIDRNAKQLHAQRREIVLTALVVAVLSALFLFLIQPLLTRRGSLIQKIRSLPRRSLAMRIGLSGSTAVLVAAALSGFLDYQSDKEQSILQMREHLLTTVRLGVTRIDADTHLTLHKIDQADAVERIPKSLQNNFITLRDTLRQIRIGANLDSAVYTLRRDGARTRFVVMSNDTPFVGTTYELRSPMKRSFMTGKPDADGPYTDGHGVWLSAWAPIMKGREPIAMLQADYEIGTLLMTLRSRALEQVLFALLGVLLAFGIAFLSARSLAQPITQIALVTAKVEGGDYDTKLNIDREDEVGQLAQAVDKMIEGLRERERLHHMFGRYMSRQVVSELLDQDQIGLDGELRDLTILITDIRGYTNLTEELGAEDVVALLNDYFTILVDEVVRREGVVDKFMGDAMLCWFGAPVPQADHAQRAVDAATQILSRLNDWNREREAKGQKPILTGIGIATGAVVVGNIGSTERLEYTAIGDAVNLSSRLCSLAEGGEIVLDHATASQSETASEDAGEVVVKGVSNPVPIRKITV